MSEHKENGSVLEGLTSNLNIEGAKKFDASKVKAQDVAIAAAVGGGEE